MHLILSGSWIGLRGSSRERFSLELRGLGCGGTRASESEPLRQSTAGKADELPIMASSKKCHPGIRF